MAIDGRGMKMSDTERILSKENLTETMDWLEAVFIHPSKRFAAEPLPYCASPSAAMGVSASYSYRMLCCGVSCAIS